MEERIKALETQIKNLQAQVKALEAKAAIADVANEAIDKLNEKIESIEKKLTSQLSSLKVANPEQKKTTVELPDKVVTISGKKLKFKFAKFISAGVTYLAQDVIKKKDLLEKIHKDSPSVFTEA